MFRNGLLLLLLCSFGAHAELVVNHPVIRLLPPGVPNTSAYFSIENRSDSERYIVSAKSEIAERVELHKHIMSGDMMRMEQQAKVTIPAGEKVIFEPGGLHLMFFGLAHPLQKEQPVNIQLQMEDGEIVSFSALPQEPGAHSHHH